ncbi:MAG: hypothetical protein NTX91_05610 [candidate division SR1 bacterium]|nr:hypothetical protein [candidate division SR1 bacterium]
MKRINFNNLENGQYFLIQWNTKKNRYGRREVAKVIDKEKGTYQILSGTEYVKYPEQWKNTLIPLLHIKKVSITTGNKVWRKINKEETNVAECHLLKKTEVQDMMERYKAAISFQLREISDKRDTFKKVLKKNGFPT